MLHITILSLKCEQETITSRFCSTGKGTTANGFLDPSGSTTWEKNNMFYQKKFESNNQINARSYIWLISHKVVLIYTYQPIGSSLLQYSKSALAGERILLSSFFTTIYAYHRIPVCLKKDLKNHKRQLHRMRCSILVEWLKRD